MHCGAVVSLRFQVVDGKNYYDYDGTYYQARMVDGGTAYVVTTA